MSDQDATHTRAVIAREHFNSAVNNALTAHQLGLTRGATQVLNQVDAQLAGYHGTSEAENK